MVSFPDWDKISRLQEANRFKTSHTAHRYSKHRDEDVIRQAEKQGYFVVPNEAFLLAHSTCEEKTKSLHKERLVKLTGLHLRKPGEIGFCVNLTICILSNNFITRIEGLESCTELVKLDLHSNQLSYLPHVSFWSGFRKLRSLHLHDNPLGRFDILHSLAACPNLSILTLFATPLSLKKNYRHHVVNSIWSLKALDHHVISDEEIIEDASFSERFMTMAPQFKLNLCPQIRRASTYKEELELLHMTEAKMNFLLAHFCPVLILQRYIRGYLTRYRLGFIPKFHSLKHITPQTSENGKRATSGTERLMPHASSTHESMPHFNSLIKLPQPDTESQAEETARTSISNEMTKDSVPGPMNSQRSDELEFIPLVKCLPETTANDSITLPKKNIFINLAKLHQDTAQILQDEVESFESQHQLNSEPDQKISRTQSKRDKRERSRRTIKSVKQFFGPVVESSPSPQVDEYGFLPEIDEDSHVTNYRIHGFKPRIAMIDATTEMILSRKEAGNLVRDAEAEHRQKIMETPKPKILSKKSINTDQRIFSKTHGTMGMSCLFAVQKAYKEREKAEKTAAKMEHILNLRDEKIRAKERIHLYHEEKRSKVLKSRDQERIRLQDHIEKREIDRLNYLNARQNRMSKTAEMEKSLKSELKFVKDFANQHTSVSNALLRHDRQARQDDLSMKNFEFVQGQRSTEMEQQETVKKYLEHRQLMRQGESSMKKDVFSAQLLQEANDRLFQAQQRVAHLKAKRESIQAFYPLPPTNVPVGAKTAPAGLSRWEAGLISASGRIGRHPTMVA